MTGLRAGKRVTATAFGMGGPIAAIVLHELFDLGVRRFLRIGTAMAMPPAQARRFRARRRRLARRRHLAAPTRRSAIPPSPISTSAPRCARRSTTRARPWRAGLFGTYDGFYTEMFALSRGREAR